MTHDLRATLESTRIALDAAIAREKALADALHLDGAPISSFLRHVAAIDGGPDDPSPVPTYLLDWADRIDDALAAHKEATR